MPCSSHTSHSSPRRKHYCQSGLCPPGPLVWPATRAGESFESTVSAMSTLVLCKPGLFSPGVFLSSLCSENPPKIGSWQPFPTLLQLSAPLHDPLHTPNLRRPREGCPTRRISGYSLWLGRRPFSACGKEPQMPELLQNSIQGAGVSRMSPSLLWRSNPGWEMAA